MTSPSPIIPEPELSLNRPPIPVEYTAFRCSIHAETAKAVLAIIKQPIARFPDNVMSLWIAKSNIHFIHYTNRGDGRHNSVIIYVKAWCLQSARYKPCAESEV